MLTTATMKKSAVTAITAVALSAVVIAGTATAAEAGKKKHHNGAAVAAGIAAFATGLAIGARPGYGGPVYGGPVYGVPVYGPDCVIEETRRYNRRGQLVIVQREICY